MLDHLPIATGKRASQRKMLRLIALLSDLSPREAEKTARQLRFSNQQIGWIRAVVEHSRFVHAEVLEAHASGTLVAPQRMRRWIAVAGRTRAPSVMRLVTARVAAEQEAGQAVPDAAAMARMYRGVLRSAFRDPVELGDLAVTGDDLRSAGVAQGPEMGWVLHRLLDVVLESPSRNTVDELLRLTSDLVGQYRAGKR
jgi:tRNA nucleotidyltransferase (CCA-adding enzyme)